MIVQRITYEVKPGRLPEAIGLLKSKLKEEVWPERRVYSSRTRDLTSPRGDVVIEDLPFESLAQLEALWAKWRTLPEAGPWVEEFVDCVESRSTELWQVKQ